MKRWAPWLVSGMIAATALSGCSEVTNSGGDTPCKEFTAQNEQEQNEAVTQMLKDQNGTDPSQLEITATREAAKVWCGTLGTPDSAIKEAPST